MSADISIVEAVVIEAQVEAAKAAREALAKYGDRDACGFAWVNIYKVKGSTKLGKELMRLGARKAYGGGLQFWNPSKMPVQSVGILEAGADAFAQVLKQRLGVEASAGSRLD